MRLNDNFVEAKTHITLLNQHEVQHINGNVYHMPVDESHIAREIWQAGSTLTNLYMADTNCCALGDGSLDFDAITMALYLIGYDNHEGCFVAPEPLGPGRDLHPAPNAKTDSAIWGHAGF